jgi:putative transposase
MTSAFNLGKRVIKIDPKGISQYCHTCLNKVPKFLEDRWHVCLKCLESLPSDIKISIQGSSVRLTNI